MTEASPSFATGFMVVQSNRMEDLCATYAQWLVRNPLQPLEQEFLVAPSNGIAQWLKHTLAQDKSQGGCGVAAGIQTMLPAQWVWYCYRQLLPGLQTRSLYDKSALTWRLFRLLQTVDLSAQAPLLQTYLGANSSSLGYFNLAAQLADLYDQYQIFRPDWLQLWQQSDYVLLDYHGQKQPLTEAHQWQGYLWQLICNDIQAQPDDQQADDWFKFDRGTLHQQFLTACQSLTNRPNGLPRRVVIFGVSSLPQTTLDVLRALAPYIQIMLFVLNPSQYYWGDLIAGKELFRTAYKRQQKRPKPASNLTSTHLDTEPVYGNPLLASWGKQGRDFLHMLDSYDQPDKYVNYFSGGIDLFSSPVATLQANTQTSKALNQGCLLSLVQDDILQLRSLEERAALTQPLSPTDSSVSFIVTHSMQREVEVLHDRLLDEFTQSHNDPDAQPLQARDILVMVPDIEAYAPHLDSVFGRYKRPPNNLGDGKAAQSDARFLPYHIADTGQRHSNPVLIAFELLLNLPNERMTSLQGLSLLEVDACRERFGINEQDLSVIAAWIKGANIRWALNADHRTAMDLPAQAGENTWQFGIERLLLGYTMGQEATWQGVAAYPQVAPMAADLLGRLQQFISALQTGRELLSQLHTPDQWVIHLLDLWQAMLVEPSQNATLYQSVYLRINQLLQTWLETIDQANLTKQPIPLDLVKENLLDNLDESRLSSHFVTGAINFATLMPMRAVPFRQIWLLGMNDDAYPRQRPYNDFDLMSHDYRPGDRSRRDDDRYLFLEALLSAREKLVIGWQGRSIKDDSLQPPSILVEQLRDYIHKGWQTPTANHTLSVLDSLTTYYPLHPFSRDYFIQPDIATDTQGTSPSSLFTYAHEWGEQAKEIILNEADKYNRPASQIVLPIWQPERALGTYALAQFLSTPVASLYHQRLAIAKSNNRTDLPESESFALSNLDAWWFNQQIIRQLGLDEANQTLPDAMQAMHQLFDYWQTSGQLLSGTAGHLQKQPFITKLTHLLTHWFALLPDNQPPLTSLDRVWQSDYALTFADQPISINLSIELAPFYSTHGHADMVEIDDMVEHPADIKQIIIQPTKIVKDKAWYWKNLCQAWVQHLAAHFVSPHPVTTYVLSPEGSAYFTPLDKTLATTYLDNLLTYWYEGMHQPLPLGLNIGMALLDNPDSSNKALIKAYEADGVLEGDFFPRHFPQLDSIDLDDTYVRAQVLYKPIKDNIEEFVLENQTPMISKKRAKNNA